MKRPYLEHIKIVSFGAFSNKAVGPFAPHLNVVYGPNEAGKTTLASFVGGVLFGWEEARGSLQACECGAIRIAVLRPARRVLRRFVRAVGCARPCRPGRARRRRRSRRFPRGVSCAASHA